MAKSKGQEQSWQFLFNDGQLSGKTKRAGLFLEMDGFWGVCFLFLNDSQFSELVDSNEYLKGSVILHRALQKPLSIIITIIINKSTNVVFRRTIK